MISPYIPKIENEMKLCINFKPFLLMTNMHIKITTLYKTQIVLMIICVFCPSTQYGYL